MDKTPTKNTGLKGLHALPTRPVGKNMVYLVYDDVGVKLALTPDD
jgi:hypothetical protein